MVNISTVLLVTDERTTGARPGQLIRDLGLEATCCADPVRCLELARELRPDLVIIDHDLPDFDGPGLVHRFKTDPDLGRNPVIILATDEHSDTVTRSLEYGAEDFIRQPVHGALFKARISNTLSRKQLGDLAKEHSRLVEAMNTELKLELRTQFREISAGHIATIFAMSKLAESRDPETGEHLERIRSYCRIIARALSEYPEYRTTINEDYVETIYAASPLHDIGKVGVPDMVLLKPGKLDADEWELMKTHSTIGSYTLKEVYALHPQNHFVRMGIEIAHSHHEKWDGSGYPEGLAGDKIPLCARILALADVYDALRSMRVYKPPFSHEKAHGIIMESAGSHFDPLVVKAYLASQDEFVRIREQFEDPLEMPAEPLGGKE